jgi:hypothetical protein
MGALLRLNSLLKKQFPRRSPTPAASQAAEKRSFPVVFLPVERRRRDF